MSINSLQDFRNTRNAIIDPAEPGMIVFQYVERDSKWIITLDATTNMFHLVRDDREEATDTSLDELERQLYTTWMLECDKDLYDKEAEQAGDLSWHYMHAERGMLRLAQQDFNKGTWESASEALNWLTTAGALRELHGCDTYQFEAETLIVKVADVLNKG